MLITINGIQKMKGHLFCGREIIDVKEGLFFHSEHYTFHFNSIRDTADYHNNYWEDEPFVIHLERKPKNGMYELYWMGLHAITCQLLNKNQIKNFQTFYSYFEKVIRMGKDYWDENNENIKN